MDRKLLDLAKEIKIFKEMNNSIIFTRADKDDITVDALDGKMYVSKVTEMYEVIKKSQRKLLQVYEKCEVEGCKYPIQNTGCYFAMMGYFREPMPKIHKQNCFSFNSFLIEYPLYQLAVFLHSIIIKNITRADSHIENSFEIVEKLNGTHLNNEYTFIG